MDVYLPRAFQRDAAAIGVDDDDLRRAIAKAEQGLIDADLGKGLIKQRIALGARGAAKGSRAIVFYRRGRIAVFLHIFAKSGKANLTRTELAVYAQAARELDRLSETDLRALSVARQWRRLEP